MGCILKRLGNEKSGLVLGLALVAAAILMMACAAGGQGERMDDIEPEQPNVSVQTIDRSLTIRDVTVTLDEVTHISTSASESVRFRYTYEHAHPNVHVSPTLMGRNITRANGTTHISQGFDDGSYFDTTLVDGIYLNTSIPSSGENLTASLGVYEIPASDDTGDITLNLVGEKRRNERGLNEIPTQAEFSVGNRRYRIPVIEVFPTKLQIFIEPANEAARRTHYGANLDEISLTDATGFSYPQSGGIQTSFDNHSPVGFKNVRMRFTGIIPESVSSLTLRIRGGREMIGPFVFEDVRVIPAGTPQAPGGAAAGIATPVGASE